MNKTEFIIKKILSAILCVCLLASVAVTASCTEEQIEPTSSDSSYQGGEEPEGAFLDGETGFSDQMLLSKLHHDIRYTQTSDTVYANGNSDYVVVLPENYSSTLNIAKSELVTFFREATGGYSLAFSTDDGLNYSANKKYISLGNTKIAEQAGVSTQGLSLKTQGYIIKTVGKSIFVMGEDRGVLMGVYKLLNIWFDFDQMNNLYYNLDHNEDTVSLYDFDITDVPDIDYRMSPYGGACNNKTVNRRMGTMYNDIFIDGTESHNILHNIVPYFDNRTAHPKWFLSATTDEVERNQLCYTAHGDAEEYEQMVECAVEHVKNLIISDPTRNIMTITQMDWNIWCTCDSCTALNKKYGTDAVSQIYFVNDVVAKVKTWLKSEMNGREVEFVIFAYNKTQKAPTVKNDKGEWVPIDETVIMKDVSIWLAPISSDYTVSVFDPKNRDLYDAFESWRPIAQKFLAWVYDCHYSDYLVPVDTYDTLQDTIKEAVRCNTSLFWAQGSYNLHNSTSFDNVKAYVYSKLMWNCMLDINDLIHDYFVKTYRAAAGTMEEAFWAMRSVFNEQDANGDGNTIWSVPVTESAWHSRYLFGQLELFEKAKNELSVYRDSDPEFYAAAMDQVRLESVGPRYLIIRIYPSAFSEYQFDAFLDSFAEDVRELDVNKFSEAEFMELFLERYNK